MSRTLLAISFTLACISCLSRSTAWAEDGKPAFPRVAPLLGSQPFCCACPDDYCRKPMPCLPGFCHCGSCDNYCRKPMPCLPCFQECWTCDDYCRKPMPSLCWPAPCNTVCVNSCGHCSTCNPAGTGHTSSPTRATKRTAARNSADNNVAAAHVSSR